MDDRPEPKITNDASDVDRARALLNTGKDPGAETHPDTESEAASPETATAPDADDAAHGDADVRPEKPEPDAASENDEDDGEAERESAEDLEEAETLNLEDLAERFDVDLEKLYATKVGLGDGRDPITLGELKDGYQSAARVTEREETLDTERRRFDEDRDGYERQTAQDRREMRLLLDVVKAEKIPPEVLEEMQARESRRRAANKAALLERFPEFADRDTYRAFADKAGSFLGERYGFRPSEMQSIDDPRTFAMVSDHMKAVERLEAAEAALDKARGELRKARKRAGREARPRANGAAQSPTAADRSRDVSRQVHDLANRR